jgi:hypothetical protein
MNPIIVTTLAIVANAFITILFCKINPGTKGINPLLKGILIIIF